MVREPADYAKLAIVVTLTASLVATASNTLMLSSKAIGGFQDKVSRAFDDTSLDEVLRSSMQQPIPATIAYRLLTENIARINKVTINSNKELELVYETSNPMNNGNSVVSGDYVEREVSLGGEVESTVLKVISPTKELNAPRTNMKEYATLSKLLQDSSFRYYVDFSNVPGSSDYDLVLYREVPRLIQATNISVSDSDNSDVATAIREAKAGIYRGNTLNLPGTSLPGTGGTSSDNATEKLQGGKFIGKVFVEDYKDSASWDTETNIPEGYLAFRDAGGNELLSLNNSADNQAVMLTLGAIGPISDGDEITSGAVQMPNKSGIIKLSNNVKMVYTKTNPSTKVASNENNKEYLDKIAELESKISELSSINDDATKDAEIERLNKELEDFKANSNNSSSGSKICEVRYVGARRGRSGFALYKQTYEYGHPLLEFAEAFVDLKIVESADNLGSTMTLGEDTVIRNGYYEHHRINGYGLQWYDKYVLGVNAIIVYTDDTGLDGSNRVPNQRTLPLSLLKEGTTTLTWRIW
jgi:hypothetical protein